MSDFTTDNLAAAFAENRTRLLTLIQKRLNPILLKRISHEDVLQEAYSAAAKRIAYFASNPEVPIYFKLRTMLLQTLTDLERRHLQAEGRDAYREVTVADNTDDTEPGAFSWDQFAADVTSPISRVDRDERHELLRKAIDGLAEHDRQILLLRHFDGMGNAECAAVLGIAPKAASIRYVRALEHLQKKLAELSCFQ
ncbi:MAG: sigma-70 family RNA polymerase sigma factor [Kiritimatiellae bacterium]|nr:sigma-70 family RNA polymerase sigma factor [Kiritimatiellia bacterium]